jgi:hypothetical protein
MYCRETQAPPKAQPERAGRIKALFKQEPSFGYRAVVDLLEMNWNAAQRIFPREGWQMK